MKINFNEVNTVYVEEIPTGCTFLADVCSERSLYLKIDQNNGFVKKICNDCIAVNLETGQLKHFFHEYPVEKVEAEVFLKK